MKKQIKSISHSKDLKIGDHVFVGDMPVNNQDICPTCYVIATPMVNHSGVMYTGETCEAHTLQELIETLGSKYMVRIEKWKDGSAWRVGLDWYSEDNYLFLCEKPTLIEAIQCASLNFLDTVTH